MSLGQWIKEQGKALGFARVGVAPATGLPELARLPEWLGRGYGGEMDYLFDPRRQDIRAVMPEARSAICCALAYDTSFPRSTELPRDSTRGWLSRYAWGDDYHGVVREKLEAFRAALAEKAGPGFDSRAYVDTGPVPERLYARHAGLGWQGKNTCLLDAELGSFFFIGVLITNLDLAPDQPLPDACGSCTLCLEACPTGALVEPYLLDARRCLSYLTIELRGPIPEEFRQPLGRHVFGCDICQDVCPYNHRAWMTEVVEFNPRMVEGETRESKDENRHSLSPAAPAVGSAPVDDARGAKHESLFHPRLDWLASLTESDFRRIFHRSAVKRTKWRGLLRNVIVAMGNSGESCFRPLLEKFAASPDKLLSSHARWSLSRLGPR